jgi:hypothetical protein
MQSNGRPTKLPGECIRFQLVSRPLYWTKAENHIYKFAAAATYISEGETKWMTSFTLAQVSLTAKQVGPTYGKGCIEKLASVA